VSDEGCDVVPFSVRRMLDLGVDELVLVGDSMALQTHVAVQCEAEWEASETGDVQIEQHGEPVAGNVHLRDGSGRSLVVRFIAEPYLFPVDRASGDLAPDLPATLQGLLRLSGRKKMVIAIGVGGWFSQAAAADAGLGDLTDDQLDELFDRVVREGQAALAAAMDDSHSIVLWRTTPPGHAASCEQTHLGTTGCHAFGWRRFRRRNDLLRSLAATHVWDVENVSVTRPDAHVGSVLPHSSDFFHFCNPGRGSVLRGWLALLQTTLVTAWS
jgi:hypothetical protein